MVLKVRIFKFWFALILSFSAQGQDEHEFQGHPIKQIKDASSTLYQCQLKDDLYLVMDNPSQDACKYCLWHSYADVQLSALNKKRYNNGFALNEMEKGALDAFEMFQEYLNLKFLPSIHPSAPLQVWVAQALTVPSHQMMNNFIMASKENQASWVQFIEMTVCVVFNPFDPFQVHMGISRNLLFEGKKHPQLSLLVHSFAAHVMRRIYPQRIYMITRPLAFMKSLLIEALPQGTFQLGKNNPDSWIQEQSQGRYRWSLSDPQGAVILQLNNRTKKFYDWLLDIAYVDYFTVELEALGRLGAE